MAGCMTLSTNDARCMGERERGKVCQRRNECQRYTERLTGGERTLVFNHMCSSDASAQYMIKITETEK
jgi:hypothetical protein